MREIAGIQALWERREELCLKFAKNVCQIRDSLRGSRNERAGVLEAMIITKNLQPDVTDFITLSFLYA